LSAAVAVLIKIVSGFCGGSGTRENKLLPKKVQGRFDECL